MSEYITNAEKAYFDTRQACFSVMTDSDTTIPEKRAAEKKRAKAYAAYAQSVLDNYFSRANLLEELIEILVALKNEISGGNASDSLDTLTRTIASVTAAFNKDNDANG